MSLAGVSYRYAKALALIADEGKSWDEMQQELCLLKSYFDENRDVVQYLNSPVVSRKAKENSLKQIVTSLALGNWGASFLFLLDRNKRLANFSRIYADFEKMKDQRDNIERVVVSTASEMDETQKASVIGFLKSQLAKKVVASFHTDRKLMEGIRIQIGSRTIENSVVSSMDQLRKKLIQIES